MKIIETNIPVKSISAFADDHDLVLEINELATPLDNPNRYRAQFRDAVVRQSHMLELAAGVGNTKQGAVEDLARAIQMRRLVVDAMTDSRREIEVPRLVVPDLEL